MKKSEMFHLAQVAVVNTPSISPERKVEVLKMLIAEENLALFCEKQKGAQNETV